MEKPMEESMAKYFNPQDYFQKRNIPFQPESGGRELRINCPFCRNPKNKCYVQAQIGCWYCFHCGESGGWNALMEGLKDYSATLESSEPINEEELPDLPPIDPEIVKEMHQRLLDSPTLIDYLHKKRGYNDETIKKYKLGWDGKNLTIPVQDAAGNYVNLRKRPDPTRPSEKKITFGITGRNRNRLFNEIILSQNLERIYICEGEWDCMLANQLGYPSVTATAGANGFKVDWVSFFSKIPTIYIVPDNDNNNAGQAGAIKTAQEFYDQAIRVKIVRLPDPQEQEEKVDLTDFLVKFGKTKQDFINLLKSAKEYTPKTNPKEPNQEGKTEYSLDPPGAIETLSDGNRLIYYTENHELVELIKTDGRIYSPPPKSNCPYYIPDAAKVTRYIKLHSSHNCQEDLKLYQELLEYHKSISDLPDEDHYELLVLWDFHTYLMEKIHFSPILYLYAVKERGKSRTGKGCIYVSKRGIWTEAVREADIIRWGNDHKAALGFDVKDAPRKFKYANCDDLILARFEKGSVSSRTLWPEKGAFKDTKTYNLFGPTIIATNRPVDDILESRSISIDMKPTSKKFNQPVVPEDAFELKCKLAAFRIAHFKDSLVEAEKPVNGRLGDIITPLHSILLTYFPDKKSDFFRLLRKIELQKKDEATDTLEAKLIEIISEMDKLVTSGFLKTADVTKKFNEGKNERLSLAEDTIGKILKGLGFAKRRNAGARGIYYDPELIAKLRFQYGISDTNDTNDTNSDTSSDGDNPEVGKATAEDQGISHQESHVSQEPLNSVDTPSFTEQAESPVDELVNVVEEIYDEA